MSVVTRFAPSPTGFLHIGGARTALFNWLFSQHHARHGNGGTFFLRIEDTDRKRSTEDAVDAIYDGLRWLGLTWDGDAISQFERVDYHRAAVERLLADGQAYRCYCAPEELAAMRQQARAEGRKRMYDGRWRDRDPAGGQPADPAAGRPQQAVGVPAEPRHLHPHLLHLAGLPVLAQRLLHHARDPRAHQRRLPPDLARRRARRLRHGQLRRRRHGAAPRVCGVQRRGRAARAALHAADQEVAHLLLGGDAHVLQLLEQNAARNAKEGGAVRVATLEWGTPARPQIGPHPGDLVLAAPDLILASGCVYGVADDVWAALVRTLAELAGPATVILLAHGNGAAPGVQQMRGRFYELLGRERFDVARVEPRALHADHRRGVELHCVTRRRT